MEIQHAVVRLKGQDASKCHYYWMSAEIGDQYDVISTGMR